MLVKSASHRIHYDLVGSDSGKVVCFIHALCADGGMWADQVPALVDAGYRVLRVDLRGHGGSDAPPGPCVMSDLASDILTVLDHESVDRVHFVGLSIGGIVGQSLALQAPERLHSLVLSDTNAASHPDAQTMWAQRLALIDQANSAAPLAPGMITRLLSPAFKVARPTRWKEVYSTIEATRPDGVRACAHALQNFDFTDQLPSLRVRTLVLCGAEDPATPPSEAKKVASLIPGAHYKEIANALHFPNIEQAYAYSEILLGWFEAMAEGTA